MTPRKVFEKELEDLRQDTIAMGAGLEKLIETTIQAIITKDKEKARQVIEEDCWFDQQEKKIEKKCILFVMQQQPLAKDLRLIVATLKIITDMERIADQCEDICKYSLKLDDGEWSETVDYKRHIEAMAAKVREMLNKTVDALIKKDVDLVKELWLEDDEIDEAFHKIWKEITQKMYKEKDFIKSGAEYIMIIKYLERIADHTTNIAEWLMYYLTGKVIKA